MTTTLHAHGFTISDPHRAATSLVALGLVCLEARYASVYEIWIERLGRRFATPAAWRAVQAELEPPPPGPLESAIALRRLLVGSEARSLVVTFARYESVELESAADGRPRAGRQRPG